MTAPDPDSRPVAPRDRFIDAGGLLMHYLDWGGEGPPIVLLHGLRDQAHEWDAIAPALVPYGQVVAPDQRGHGGTDRPRTGYDPADFAGDLEAFCTALDLDRPVVIGHSMGARTAYAFAATRPGRLRGLVLVDIGAQGAPETIPAMVEELRANDGPFSSADDAIRALIGPELAPSTALRAYVGHNLRQTGDGLLAWAYNLDAAIETVRRGRGRDWWDVVARIGVPTLLVRGARSDVLGREEAARMIETIPDAVLVEIPGAGHLVPQVRPRELAAAIIGWLPAVLDGVR